MDCLAIALKVNISTDGACLSTDHQRLREAVDTQSGHCASVMQGTIVLTLWYPVLGRGDIKAVDTLRDTAP